MQNQGQPVEAQTPAAEPKRPIAYLPRVDERTPGAQIGAEAVGITRGYAGPEAAAHSGLGMGNRSTSFWIQPNTPWKRDGP